MAPFGLGARRGRSCRVAGLRGSLRFVQHANVADETKPLAGQGADQALAFTIIADSAARRVDPGRERGFGDDPPGPHRVQHVIAADDVATVANEVFEKVEHLRLHRDDHVAVPKLAPLGIERVFVENKYHS